MESAAEVSADLTGKGVLVAVIDSGIDYLHPDFQASDGTSRILYLWDQDRDTVYTKEEINEALSAYREGAGGKTGLGHFRSYLRQIQADMGRQWLLLPQEMEEKAMVCIGVSRMKVN